MSLIYKITNKLNDKVYIGSTKRTLEQRFTEHCRKGYAKHSLLTRAILKYGKEHFEIVELLSVSDEERILKEHELIVQMNSLCPVGYNLIDNSKYGFSNGYLVKRRPTELCLQKARLSRLGSKHTEETKAKIRAARKKQIDTKCKKPIIAIKECFVIPFESIKEASIFFNISASTISLVLNGWKPSYKGFSFQVLENK